MPPNVAVMLFHKYFLTTVDMFSLGLTLAAPSVSGYTLTASFPSLQTTISTPTTPTTPATTSTPSTTAAAAVSETSTAAGTTSYSSNVATPTSQTYVTATASSNITAPAYTGGANIVATNKLLAGFGLGLYYALC